MICLYVCWLVGRSFRICRFAYNNQKYYRKFNIIQILNTSFFYCFTLQISYLITGSGHFFNQIYILASPIYWRIELPYLDFARIPTWNSNGVKCFKCFKWRREQKSVTQANGYKCIFGLITNFNLKVTCPFKESMKIVLELPRQGRVLDLNMTIVVMKLSRMQRKI